MKVSWGGWQRMCKLIVEKHEQEAGMKPGEIPPGGDGFGSALPHPGFSPFN